MVAKLKLAKQKHTSLFQEAVNALVLCGTILFAYGLFLSQKFAENQTIQLTLVCVALAGGCFLLLLVGRFRTRLAATDALERQLVAIVQNQEPDTSQLNPILDQTAAGRGWNSMVELVNKSALEEGIDRRLQENVSSRKTERFGRAVRSLPEGLAITDSQGAISYANPAWVSLIGQEDEDEAKLLGSTVVHCMAKMEFTNWEDHLATLSQGVRPITVNLNRGHNIHDGVLQLSRIPLEGRANESAGFVWTLRDITQSALARDSHEQFLASATHELRTPLTNIRGYTESLLEIEDISPDQQKEFFNVIYSEAGRLGRLLNELLDIQQLEAGSMTVQSNPFDVLRMVQEVQEHIGPLMKEKELKFVCRIAPNLKTIHADKEKITSCLVNLLGNAAKYTPDGGEVRLIAEQLESSVNISVEDNGIGIADDELPKIFERFYRCQDERVNKLEGNGLGLSFCMEVARLHGGELTVDSQLNKGSRFTLKIPLTHQV